MHLLCYWVPLLRTCFPGLLALLAQAQRPLRADVALASTIGFAPDFRCCLDAASHSLLCMLPGCVLYPSLLFHRLLSLIPRHMARLPAHLLRCLHACWLAYVSASLHGRLDKTFEVRIPGRIKRAL